MGGAARRRRDEVAKMRVAGRVVAEMHERTRAALRPGVTTADLDQVAREVLERRGAQSNFLGYHGFPAVICTSVNDVIVHGIPGERRLEEGDLVSVDCGAIVDGWHGDAAYTAGVGELRAEDRRMIDTAEAALAAGVAELVDGHRLGDLGNAVERVIEGAGYGLVAEYTGHAIGRAMHESPSVPNWGEPGSGPRIRVGNVYAIEPMLTAGSPDSQVLDDGWTVVPLDGGRAVHVEHTVAVTGDGPEILTLP
jgi:methionyl aminopeptidase